MVKRKTWKFLVFNLATYNVWLEAAFFDYRIYALKL